MPAVECGFPDTAGLSGRQRLVAVGATLEVVVTLDPAYPTATPQTPADTETRVSALVDTGASACCIDVSLAEQLGLPVVDHRTISGIGGAVEVAIYRVQLQAPALRLRITGSMPGVHLAAGQQPHRVLIGRDFLQYFTMRYAGPAGSVQIRRDTARQFGRSWWAKLFRRS